MLVYIRCIQIGHHIGLYQIIEVVHHISRYQTNTGGGLVSQM